VTIALVVLAGCGDGTGDPRDPGPHGVTADGRLPRLTDRQAAAYLSVPWNTKGPVVPGRPFIAVVGFGSCEKPQGVHFARVGDTTEVAVLVSGPGRATACTAELIVGSFPVDWPADLPARGRVVHAKARRP
jgi:hypothetical protein